MKQIEAIAIIKPSHLAPMNKAGITGMRVSEVKYFARRIPDGFYPENRYFRG